MIILKVIFMFYSLSGILRITGILKGKPDGSGMLYYTYISNALVATFYVLYVISELTGIWSPDNGFYVFMHQIGLKYIVTMCIFLTGMIYHFMLGGEVRKRNKAGDMSDKFWTYDNITLHYGVPIMTFIDFMLFDDKSGLSLSYAFIWVFVPLCYIIFIFIRAALGGGNIATLDSPYPYPFIDLRTNGPKKTIINIIVIFIMFLILGIAVYYLGKLTNKIFY